jgi:DNA-binding Xre family transcriptional regulator
MEEIMAVSYNNLWKLMIDKKINKSELCKTIKISTSTMAKMTNEEMVALPILEKICAELECNIGDIMEFTELEDVRKKIHQESLKA